VWNAGGELRTSARAWRSMLKSSDGRAVRRAAGRSAARSNARRHIVSAMGALNTIAAPCPMAWPRRLAAPEIRQASKPSCALA
jgi:hypothetical protein